MRGREAILALRSEEDWITRPKPRNSLPKNCQLPAQAHSGAPDPAPPQATGMTAKSKDDCVRLSRRKTSNDWGVGHLAPSRPTSHSCREGVGKLLHILRLGGFHILVSFEDDLHSTLSERSKGFPRLLGCGCTSSPLPLHSSLFSEADA